MASRKKYTVLNMQQRLDVLKHIQDPSLSASDIGKKFGVDARTVHRIKQNSAQINTFADKSKQEKARRKLIDPVYDELDKDLLSWFLQRRLLGDHITDALMLEKARKLREKLPSCSRFKASSGWLSQFKKRHSIRLRNICGEKSSADQDSVETFVDNFKRMIEEENISTHNMYKMDESELVWKALPTKTLAGRSEGRICGFKQRKDRITIGLCANASGSHKVTPMVIYKYKNPKALKHESSLPVILKSQANAWMDRGVFLDWFENHFKPSVRDFQHRHSLSGKVLLLLDNCEGHKVSQDIQNKDDFKIIFLPANTASIIQPMDQGIIEKTKRIFRHKVLQRVLTYENGVVGFQKDYNLKNCIDILSQSWSEITTDNIRIAWNNIIRRASSPSQATEDELAPAWEKLLSVVTGEDCGVDDVRDYLSECEDVERINEDHCSEEEEAVVQDEPPEEANEIAFAQINDTEKTDLKNIFDRLSIYSHRAPLFVQTMVQGLRQFFLGIE